MFGGNLQFINFAMLDNEKAGIECVEMKGDYGLSGPGMSLYFTFFMNSKIFFYNTS